MASYFFRIVNCDLFLDCFIWNNIELYSKIHNKNLIVKGTVIKYGICYQIKPKCRENELEASEEEWVNSQNY